MTDPNPLLILLGPTASGKTKLAVKLADVLGGEIISADSRQVFKKMDLGTGKDLNEYTVDGKAIPYHLIDIREPGEKYNVNQFKDDFYEVFERLTHKGTLPILCGGTGMYIHSILQQHEYTSIPVDEVLRGSLLPLSADILRELLKTYPVAFTIHADPSSHKRMVRAIEIAEYLQHNEFSPPLRPAISPVVIGLTSAVLLRRSKVISRLAERLNAGMIDEVSGLIANGVSKETLESYGLEYKFITRYLFKEISYDALREQLGIAICQFAKRQMTFFRKMEKDGVKIHWFDSAADPEDLSGSVLKLYTDSH